MRTDRASRHFPVQAIPAAESAASSRTAVSRDIDRCASDPDRSSGHGLAVMARNPRRLEVPAITGDRTVVLAAPPSPADGFHGLTERLRPFAAEESQQDPLHIGGRNGGDRESTEPLTVHSKRVSAHNGVAVLAASLYESRALDHRTVSALAGGLGHAAGHLPLHGGCGTVRPEDRRGPRAGRPALPGAGHRRDQGSRRSQGTPRGMGLGAGARHGQGGLPARPRTPGPAQGTQGRIRDGGERGRSGERVP